MRYPITPLLAAAVTSVLSLSSAYADHGDPLYKLLASDGSPLNQFGFSVAISGTRAIVGAKLDDENGEDAGSAYLYDTNTAQPLFELLPDDRRADDEFGSSVAINGTRAIAGAPKYDFNDGSAYLFDTTPGTQRVRFLPWMLPTTQDGKHPAPQTGGDCTTITWASSDYRVLA